MIVLWPPRGGRNGKGEQVNEELRQAQDIMDLHNAGYEMENLEWARQTIEEYTNSCPVCGGEMTNPVAQLVDLDPASAESGPQPDVVELEVCGEACKSRLRREGARALREEVDMLYGDPREDAMVMEREAYEFPNEEVEFEEKDEAAALLDLVERKEAVGRSEVAKELRAALRELLKEGRLKEVKHDRRWWIVLPSHPLAR